jgi:hypothetical protein
MQNIQKDSSHTIHLLHIPEISHYIFPDDAASPVHQTAKKLKLK